LGIGANVQFLGHRDDVARILCDVDIVMQPSLTEGLSNTILESMAAGRAVVATPVGGNPEVIRHGTTGWLVPVSSPRVLGEAASALIEDAPRRAALGLEARRLVREQFSVEAMVQATEGVYRDLLRRARRHRVREHVPSPVSGP
jgi:glycosyltransferase involved in cell wall biosynthesis